MLSLPRAYAAGDPMNSNMDDYAIVMADRAGTIQFINPGAEAMLGHRAIDAIGQRLDAIIPDEYREKHWAGFRKAMEAGTAAAEGTAFDLPVLCSDGSVLMCPATFVLIRDGQKNTIGAMAILRQPGS